MISAQQYLQPQQAVVGTQITDLLSGIMPLIMIMMVFMMITPMMKGMGEAFK